MQLIPLGLSGAFIIEPDFLRDERGFFARLWDESVLGAHALETRLSQCSISYNARQGTLRGMHYQGPPKPETKIVRCTAGHIYDVIVDIRPDSPTYLKWEAVELSAENRRSLFIPMGMAHGFQTLSDDAEVFYMISEAYHPDCQGGLRYDDPLLGIKWPLPVSVISQRDKEWPLSQSGRILHEAISS